MAKLSSEERINLFISALNDSKNFEDATKTCEGDLPFVIAPDVELKDSSTFWSISAMDQNGKSSVFASPHSS